MVTNDEVESRGWFGKQMSVASDEVKVIDKTALKGTWERHT